MNEIVISLVRNKIILFSLSVILGVILVIFYFKLTNIPSPKAIQKIVSNFTQFNPGTAPNDSLKGNIATFSGTVKWQSRIATEAAQINLPVPIQQGE